MSSSADDIASRLRFQAQVHTMNSKQMRPLELSARIEKFALRIPFTITGYTLTDIECVVVTLRRGAYEGRGEAAGVYYKNDLPAEMLVQIESARNAIEAGVDRGTLQQLMPSTGAQNAIDCALWELEAQERDVPVWERAGLCKPRPLMTTWTIGADTPGKMAQLAQGYTSARALKLKLLGDGIDDERVREVRAARPDVWLAVDANQGFSAASFGKLLPTLIDADVRLIEQPYPVGQDALLDEVQCPIPFAADESVQTLRDIPAAQKHYDYINIKLDKCGGLTEALHMARLVQSIGLKSMVGNMVGTSLAMAPAFIVGQLSEVVDLDGPLLLASDRPNAVTYTDGLIDCPDVVWGHDARRNQTAR
jgi:L-alanine-DL-glutamate epimerase-like enolase superfamily enzyme